MTVTRRTFRILSLALLVAIASATFEGSAYAADGILKKIEKALTPPPPPPRPAACACVRG